MKHLYQDCTILHVDADGFFASVEQALDPALRGRPVVTGAERGIIAAASYEARSVGIKRGLQLHEARARCPGLVVVPSDYEAYSLYSHRLFAILRRFTPKVEEYSIDEAFADLRGCEDALGMTQEEVAATLRQTVQRELGLTVSVGISLTKTLAKICSKFRKPNGQTILRREHLALMLRRTPVEKVWGIGPASAAKLHALKVKTAQDFVLMEAGAVKKALCKPGFDTWMELRGQVVISLDLEPKARYESMMKGHTFAPPSVDARLVYAEASRNLVAAFARLRRHRHLARELGLQLRRKDYSSVCGAASLPAPTACDSEAIPVLRALFNKLYEPDQCYRATLVWLGGLEAERHRQMDFFEDTSERRLRGELAAALDGINRRYGQESVVPAAMLELRLKPDHARDARPRRYTQVLQDEGARHLALPRLTLPNPI